jgi:hypothetical protein
MGLPRGMREVPAELRDKPVSGASLVRAFVRIWDAHAAATSGPNPFLTLVQALCSSPRAADSLREFITEQIAPGAARLPRDGDWRIRQALIGSQLVGLAFQRYILRAEPVASASPGQLAAWAGPAIDRYLREPITATADLPAQGRLQG